MSKLSAGIDLADKIGLATGVLIGLKATASLDHYQVTAIDRALEGLKSIDVRAAVEALHASDEHAGPVVGRKGDQGADHEGPSASVDAQDVRAIVPKTCNYCGHPTHWCMRCGETQTGHAGKLAVAHCDDCRYLDDPHVVAVPQDPRNACIDSGAGMTGQSMKCPSHTQNACPDCKLLGKWCGVHGAQAQQDDRSGGKK